MTNESEKTFENLKEKSNNELFEDKQNANTSTSNNANTNDNNNANDNENIIFTNKDNDSTSKKQKNIYLEDNIINRVKQIKNRTGHSETYIYNRLLKNALSKVKIE